MFDAPFLAEPIADRQRSPSKGWVAVSDHIYRMEGASGGFRWLDSYTYVRVGKSIRLIYIP